jgi:hypothetical protein
MTTQNYKPLKEEISKDGFLFKQLKRKKNKAIYEQSKDGKIFAYEVIVIGCHEGYSIAGNYIEPSEMYPSSTQWGIKGFTYTNLEDAEKKYKTLK